MPFKSGQSGNPSGRPVGIGKQARYRKLLESHADKLIQKAVDMALSGDSTALKLCFERLLPPTREDAVKLPLSGSLSEQGQQILQTLGAGNLTPSQAAKLLTALANQARLVEIDDIEKRIAALEDAHHADNQTTLDGS